MEILNRRAYYDYSIIEHYEAGIMLTGSEIKSIRGGEANLNEAYVFINNGEVFVKNMYISKFEQSSYLNHEEKRDRKLLLSKTQILKIEKYLQTKGTVIIPIKVFFSKRWAKLKIGVGRGKKTYDKRESIKERESKRELSRLNSKV
jgi:SsrA-binding protein